MSDARGDPTGAVFRACRDRAGNVDLAVNRHDELAAPNRVGQVGRWAAWTRAVPPSHLSHPDMGVVGRRLDAVAMPCRSLSHRPTPVWVVGLDPDPCGDAMPPLEGSIGIQRT